MQPEPGEVTQLLRKYRSGQREVEPRLIELIYGELRRIAGARMQGERASHTLTPTALVHEAYLRLTGVTRVEYQDRTHFLAVAANLMRRVLVDHARARSAAKRGGAVPHTELQGIEFHPSETAEELIALDEALVRLDEISPRQSRVVELRYFAGLTEDEVAEVLGVTRRTATRDWKLARAWLYGEISGQGETST